MRDLVVELSPLIADKDLLFELDSDAVTLQSHPWMLRELTRNLLHNAIQHSPHGVPLRVSLVQHSATSILRISDSGHGVSSDLQSTLAEPFVTGGLSSGSGLGLAICKSIVHAISAQLHLQNRVHHGQIEGFDAVVELKNPVE